MCLGSMDVSQAEQFKIAKRMAHRVNIGLGTRLIGLQVVDSKNYN